MKTRADYVNLTDRMLTAVMPYATASGAQINLPGPANAYGRETDGLEGFTRTFMLAAFRIHGAGPDEDLSEVIEFYTKGLAAGVDPNNPERWERPDEAQGHAKVESASLALALDLTRDVIWDKLNPEVQQNVINYLASVIGLDYIPNNWVWFQVVVETFLHSVGGPWSPADIEKALAVHDSLVKPDGWITDGIGNNYDHYNSWALHFYPQIWQQMKGAAELTTPERTSRDRALLEKWLDEAVYLVGKDGPLIQGRSLTYRFGTAAAFWAAIIASIAPEKWGLYKRAIDVTVSSFTDHGVPDNRDLLNLGWHQENLDILQPYSGSGSPYWAAKGLSGILLPADHPIWQMATTPLPIESGAFLRLMPSPGWIVFGSADDGVVRVVNHGTDARPFNSDTAELKAGLNTSESPWYHRYGYSTKEFPVLSNEGWESPYDNVVALRDNEGRTSHRVRFELLGLDYDPLNHVAFGASTSTHCWFTPSPEGLKGFRGLNGETTPAGQVTVISVVRNGEEVRLARIDNAEPGVVGLRFGGWPVQATGHRFRAAFGKSTSDSGSPKEEIIGQDGNPLGGQWATPVLDLPVQVGQWVAVRIQTPEPTSIAYWVSLNDAVEQIPLKLDESDPNSTQCEFRWSDHTFCTFNLSKYHRPLSS